MRIQRDIYLNRLILRKHNGLIKVITGVQRCGKTYLLFELFYQHLRDSGVDDAHIIRLSLDDIANREYREPLRLYHYVKEQIKDEKMYYVLLDEVQFVAEFEDVLNGFLHLPNVDTYVSGSNAKFLSKDVITEFRGRGDEVRIYPLTFREFMQAFDGTREEAWDEYVQHGGMPALPGMHTPEEKRNYLKNLFTETYLKDIIERNHIRNEEELAELLDLIASQIGSPVNPKKISDTFKSVKNVSVHPDTIKNYLDYLSDAFLIEKVKRYDVKGKKYIGTPMKYYFTDVGLRNARLNFRQIEQTHLMENIIYNELRVRGYDVDVGVVEINSQDASGKNIKPQLEVDFVCNQMPARIYIQSVLSMPDREKRMQEQRPFGYISDSFQKVIIAKDVIGTWYSDEGVLMLNLFDFLLNPNSLRR